MAYDPFRTNQAIQGFGQNALANALTMYEARRNQSRDQQEMQRNALAEQVQRMLMEKNRAEMDRNALQDRQLADTRAAQGEVLGNLDYLGQDYAAFPQRRQELVTEAMRTRPNANLADLITTAQTFAPPAPKIEKFGDTPWLVSGNSMSVPPGYTPTAKPSDYKEREMPMRGNMVQKQALSPDGTWQNVGDPYSRYAPKEGGTGTGRTGGGKTMPAAALKLQQEALDILSTAANMKADLGAIRGQLDRGELDLGPADNLWSQARNYAGMSSPESRNFATFRASLEKMRNDSLRLNKGVQTEGDAQRAWNELMSSINDPQLVKDRLAEIEAINDRAVLLQRMNIDNIRANYGHEPLDTTIQENPITAIDAQPGASRGGSGPKPGIVEDGYRFIGGDPANPNSWKKVR